MAVYAHSAPGRPFAEWETLPRHAGDVAALATFAAPFGFASLARAAGLLHDIGKCSPAFQAYIPDLEDTARGPDHSTAGAREALRAYPGPVGRMLAFIIAGHHAGVADGTDLEGRLQKPLEPYDGWDREIGPLGELKALSPTRPLRPGHTPRFRNAFLIRMLFSCLVDADFIATEAFYAGIESLPVERDGFTPLAVLRERLGAFMAAKQAGAEPSELNRLRASILEHAVGKADLPPGLFTLTGP